MGKNMSRLCMFFMLGWFFLLQGYGRSTGSSPHSIIVGPIDSAMQCRQIASEATSVIKDSWILYRATSCWEMENGQTK